MLETRLINGEKMNLDEAVVKNDRLIWSVVQRYVGKGKKWGLEPDDLHSICCIGLIKAFNNFDPDTYDVKFSTYAVPMMIGELQRYFRDSAGDVKFSRRTIEFKLVWITAVQMLTSNSVNKRLQLFLHE